MSLQVWLPLNGTLNDQGCSIVDVENSGATVDDAGKIGKCYSFNGNTDYISLTSPILYSIFTGQSQPFSITFWIYHNDTVRGVIFGDYALNGAINFNIELANDHRVRFYWASNPNKYFNTDSNVGLQQWTHIAITYDGSIINLYKNGILTDSYSKTLSEKNKTTGSYYLGRDSRTGETSLNGKLNDFRIYDHCLSAAEVHEISQGLVLHYKLDDNNTSTIVVDSSGYGNHGTIIGEFEYSLDTKRYEHSINLINTGSKIQCGRGGMVTDSITVNIWFKVATWDTIVSCTQSGGWNFEYNTNNDINTITFPIYIGSSYKYPKLGANSEIITKNSVTNNWHMMTGVYDRVNKQVKLYLDGELKQQNTISNSDPIVYHASNSLWIGAEALGTFNGSEDAAAGLFSDFRIYCTPLVDNDIKMLYNIGMKVDNTKKLHCLELKESTSRELLQGINIVSGYTTHNDLAQPHAVNSNGELYFSTQGDSAGTMYIPVNPIGHTYYYDIEVSIDANNQFYLGFERYDANKTPRSNNACVYKINVKPTTALSHKRYFGIVDLSTDGVNPCAFIALRILNAWSSTTGTSIIHKLSLREVTTLQNPKLYKTGVLLTDEFNEHQRASFYQNGFVEATDFIEI